MVSRNIIEGKFVYVKKVSEKLKQFYRDVYQIKEVKNES